ncbi:PH domain-containing protein [Bacillus cereus group sp. TH152-1LC]|uniref:PH domain-containing protein n=1 Tax=Bacillus cereus group sp. TH152-1LC TaxID=3018060 RepID=UPI0022E8A98C|nr:PH domain-containing protein [Bacillus cereus group sp. TH152-1LC]MDA1680923.1 PH domain-containing protein [Bacillus cereus group sp. TH152-1LC]
MKNVKTAMTLVQSHLNENESIENCLYGMFQYQVFGMGGQRKGILVATNERMCFYTKYLGSETFKVFDYAKVNSIEVEKGLLTGNKIIFYHDGEREVMNLIEEGDLEGFAVFVKEKIMI